MSDENKIDPKQQEIEYYKKRVKQLSSSFMGVDQERVRLNQDLIQMSDGLKIISELQYVDSNSGDSTNGFLDQITEIINLRLKMDVTMVLMPEEGVTGFKPKYIKSYSGYPIDKIESLDIELPEDFVKERQHLMVKENTESSPVIDAIRDSLGLPYFILYPIQQVDNLFGYLFVGRRELVLKEGSGLMPYHLSTVEAIAGVIIALKNQIERNEILETLVEERTGELAKEKEISDQLLLNILPYEISQELKANGSSKPRFFDTVTVLFTDFKDFSRISAGLSPQVLVDEIDFYYSQFDSIITKHGLEKIKTIGDSYMCAAGLPIPDNDHAIKAANAAMEIRDFIAEQGKMRKKDGRPYFDIRIGMHSGPVVAGIVGIKKFAYDIWGDTVNVAARMESKAEPGKINISESTYNLIKSHFHCENRGAIEVKHKGQVEMYFIKGPILSPKPV